MLVHSIRFERARKEQLMTIYEIVRKMIDKQRVANIRKAFARWRLNTVPAEDVWFELEVDDVNPMSVVTTAGYDVNGWEYLGPKLSGKRKLRVKLVRPGYVRNLDELNQKGGLGYRLAEGQAREPFKAKFPKPDDKGSIMFGGSGWRHPDGSALVACLLDGFGDGWVLDFFCSENEFHGDSRLLVVGKELSSA